METIDSFIIVLIFFISFIIRIWNIAIPDYVVFDEFHFGQFTNDYINHNFFFDIHPPLGKLLYYLFAKLIHYKGNLSFTNDDIAYTDEIFVFFRIIPAILTSFVSCFIYIILRNSFIFSFSSFFTSSLLIFELSMISQSRFILIEGIQHFFICFHLLILSFSKNAILIGISLGLSISVKMTSFSLLPFTLIYVIIVSIQNHEYSNKSRIFLVFLQIFLKIFSIFLIVFFVFISITMIHLSLLTNITNDAIEFLPSDLFNDIFKNKENQSNIKIFFHHIKNSIKLNFLMNEINQKNKQIHPYSSLPIQWPLLTGIWVGMWSDEFNDHQINCMGNCFVFYFVFFGLIKRIFQIIKSLIQVKKNKIDRFLNVFVNLRINVASFAFFGWIFSYFPFFFVKRTLFLYHYQVSLLFGVLNFGFVQSKNSFLFVLMSAILACFGFFYYMENI